MACGMEVMWNSDGERWIRKWPKGGNRAHRIRWGQLSGRTPQWGRMPVDWTELPDLDIDGHWPPCRGRSKR